MYKKSEDREDYQRTEGALAAMARDLPSGLFIPPHSHRRSQLIYGTTGSITVSTDAGKWVVPSHRTVWVPAGTEHAMTTHGQVEMRTLYVEPNARSDLPTSCKVLSIGPLMRELIKEATRIPINYERGGRDERLIELILDELQPLRSLPLHLPWPKDPRASAACTLIFENVDSNLILADIGKNVGASARSLERLFPRETGLTFAEWKRQARLLRALELLALGEPVSSTAYKVGYESVSAFSVVFRTFFGTTPSKYFDDPN